MTTYTLKGIGIYSGGTSNDGPVLDANVTQKFVVPDSVTSFSYTETPLAPGVPNLATFSLDAYQVLLDEKDYQPTSFPNFSFLTQVNWTDASGIARSTYILDYVD